MPGKFVLEAGQRLQGGDHVLDVAGLQEAHAADKTIGDPGRSQRVFYHPGVSRTAEHQHDLARRDPVPQLGANAFQREICLVEVGMERVERRTDAAKPAVGAKLFVVVHRRCLQKHVGDIQYLLVGSIVLREAQRDAVGQLVAEIMDTFEVRSPERVDALGVVAHAEKVDRRVQFPQDRPLDRAGILHLVHEDVVVLVPDKHLQAGYRLQIVCRLPQDIIEIHQPVVRLVLVVAGDDFLQIPGCFIHGRRIKVEVLIHVYHGVVHVRKDSAKPFRIRDEDFGSIFREIELVAQLVHNGALVVPVNELEPGRLKISGMMPHDIQAEPVKCPDEHRFAHSIDLAVQPFADFLRGFAGERQQGDLFRGDMQFPVQEQGSGDQCSGLPASCPGENEQSLRAVVVTCGAFLLHVQCFIPSLGGIILVLDGKPVPAMLADQLFARKQLFGADFVFLAAFLADID